MYIVQTGALTLAVQCALVAHIINTARLARHVRMQELPYASTFNALLGFLQPLLLQSCVAHIQSFSGSFLVDLLFAVCCGCEPAPTRCTVLHPGAP
jgi:hypothetical protein